MFASLPLHPLVVHVPIVLLPAAAIGTIILAVKPSLVTRWGLALAIVAGVGFIGALASTETGESLEHTRRESGERISSALHDHAELGEQARTLAFGLFLIIAAMWFLDRFEFSWKRSWMTPTLRIAGVLVAVATAFITYRTGHTGASSVWDK